MKTEETTIKRQHERMSIPPCSTLQRAVTHLMCSRDESEPIVVIERLGDVLTKRVASPARADAPSTAVIGVRP